MTDYYTGLVPGPADNLPGTDHLTGPAPDAAPVTAQITAAQPQHAPQPGRHASQQIKHDTLAKWAFGVVWFIPLAGIIMSHINNHQRKARQMSRDGLAVAALWIGYVWAALWTALWIVLIAMAAASPSVSAFTPAVATAPAPAVTAPAAPAAQPSTPAAVPSTDPSGALGTAANVTDSSGDAYSVTATRVIDPAQPANSYDGPSNGHHFVGVAFTVKVTSGKLDDAADNCAALMGSDGQSYDTTVSSIAGYDNTSTLVKLSAGETQNVMVVFEVPNGVHPTSVKWTPDSGMGDSTATWTVTSTTAQQAPAAQAASAVPAGYTDAGDGVYAGPNTSTSFALAVHQAWLNSGKASTVQAYSPVTGKTYTMTQAGTSPYLFTGGNNASVEWWA